MENLATTFLGALGRASLHGAVAIAAVRPLVARLPEAAVGAGLGGADFVGGFAGFGDGGGGSGFRGGAWLSGQGLQGQQGLQGYGRSGGWFLDVLGVLVVLGSPLAPGPGRPL